MWQIFTTNSRTWTVTLNGVPLRTSFATFDAALQWTTSADENDVDARARANDAQG